MASGWPIPVTPQAPISLCHESFEQRPDGVLKHLQRHEPAGVDPPPHRVAARHDVGVQEKQIEPVELRQAQAGLDRLPEDALDPLGRRIAQVAFGGDADAGWKAAAERLADHLLGLAVAIAGREVEQRDPRIRGGLDRGDAFFARGGAPELAQPATAQGQDGYLAEAAECLCPHGPRPPAIAASSPMSGCEATPRRMETCWSLWSPCSPPPPSRFR